MYTITSIKTAPESVHTLDRAIERAREIAEEYDPAFGADVTSPEGDVVWRTED